MTKKQTLLILFFGTLLIASYFLLLISAARAYGLPIEPLHALGILICLLFALRIAGLIPDN